jgi:hypothetical protein
VPVPMAGSPLQDPGSDFGLTQPGVLRHAAGAYVVPQAGAVSQGKVLAEIRKHFERHGSLEKCAELYKALNTAGPRSRSPNATRGRAGPSPGETRKADVPR